MPDNVEISVLQSQFGDWLNALGESRRNAGTLGHYAELTGRIEFIEWLSRSLEAYSRSPNAEANQNAGPPGDNGVPEGEGSGEVAEAADSSTSDA